MSQRADAPRVVNGETVHPRKCRHAWKPAGMVFETQLLDGDGRVIIRQPDLDTGRVYLVCLLCASHTYMSTSWTGYRLYGSEDTTNTEGSPHD